MSDYCLHELSTSTFETVVNSICQEVLGTGAVNFAEGPDGGRDGRFEGTAENFPSSQSSWSGKFIVQAKRKSDPSSKCSDVDFIQIVKEESKKLKKLCAAGEIDYYLLFTSRKLPAGAEEKIRKLILDEVPLKGISVLGKEYINLTLDRYPSIVTSLQLSKYVTALRIFPDNIKAIMVALVENKQTILSTLDSQYRYDFLPDIDKKNELNNLSKEYFESIKKRYESYFYQIEQFLNNPLNSKYSDYYYNIADEINNKILIHKHEYAKFEEILENIFDQAIASIPDVWEDSRLLNVLLHFMYCHCDIGEIPRD